ncbi:MAG: hypothetical protein HWE12_13695 [Oceanospirillaceae bacterium]|nr:hypothetical protein [Oceanospirillaceae bacterium]
MSNRKLLAVKEAPKPEKDLSLLKQSERALLQAVYLNQDSSAEEIKEVLRTANSLSVLERRDVLGAISVNSGVPLKELKADSAKRQPDQLTLAKKIVASMNKREHIVDPNTNSLWCWDRSHWRELSDTYLESDVQELLPLYSDRVTNSDVTSVAKLIKRELYKIDHCWNQGGQDAINVLNGELHLKTNRWQLSPHNPQSYYQSVVPIEYDRAATAPRFQQFLTEVFDGDDDAQEKAQCVLEMLGYTLVAHCKYEAFIVLIGQGANGKSVLLDLLRQMLGNAFSAVQPIQFNNKFQRAGMQGKLANIVSELPQGGMLPDDVVKAMVSGESVTVERKNQDPFEYNPFATLWFGTNHMPHTRDHSEGVFRRGRILQFNNCFDGSNRDPNLTDKLFSERAGILNLALDAYAQVVTNGRVIDPPSSLAAKQMWSYNSDQIAQFISEEVVVEAGARIRRSTLYERYRGWTYAAGITKPYGKNQFFQRIREKRFKEVKSSGEFYFEGIKPNIVSVSL